MKITLDLSKLVEDGKLTPAEAERLKALAAQETSHLGLNILTGFGVIAASAGAVAFLLTVFQFTAGSAAIIGGIVFILGLALLGMRGEVMSLLSQTLIIIGALTGAVGLLILDDGSLRAALFVTVVFAGTAILARSSLMAALSVVSLAGCLGARTGYVHAMYSLSIQEPTLTIVIFSALALALYLISLRVRADYERIAITAARMAIVLVNFGFWIGSLWGDRLRLWRWWTQNDVTGGPEFTARGAVIPDWVFSILWAIALIAVGVWGVKAGRRWVVNVAAVFGGIHFYTQWFSILGANAFSVLLAGVILIAIAMGIRAFNRQAAPATA
jgi:iron complex transport system permease protein